jgi:hypothetical protein
MPQPRTPSRLKQLHGTFRPPRAREGADTLDALNTAPKYLTGRQRELFLQALAAAPPGLSKRPDRDLLAAWAISSDRLREANRRMPTFTDPDKRRAWRRELTEATRLLVLLGDRLGFSPVAR